MIEREKKVRAGLPKGWVPKGCQGVLWDRVRLCERDAVDGGWYCRQHKNAIEKMRKRGVMQGPPWSGDPPLRQPTPKGRAERRRGK
jgi:hypothetical protein